MRVLNTCKHDSHIKGSISIVVRTLLLRASTTFISKKKRMQLDLSDIGTLFLKDEKNNNFKTLRTSIVASRKKL